jgi:hypothetical protein
MAESSGKSGGKAAATSDAKADAGAKDTSTSDAKDTAASDTKDTAASDSKSGDKADGSGKSSDYSRGENQKVVTKAYRSNWDDVFGKKSRGKSKK